MAKKKKQQGDFRYSVGDARVPWHAVGEFYSGKDATAVLEFLLRPGDDSKAYREALKDARQAVAALAKVSRPATKLTLGGTVEKAEAAARDLLGVKHACLLANWTGGMEIGYKLSGLRPGDEVILPSITFISTMLYPLMIGAKVVFADIDPKTVNIDPEDVARKITKKTRVIVPVHIGGYPCDMDALMKIARDNDIYVMEDAAHGFGARYKGKPLGAIAHFGGYSFHEVKNVNSFGEGGLLVSNLDCGEQFPRARFCGLDFSRAIKDWLYDITPLTDRFGKPQVPGNCSVTELQALGFLIQLKRLDRVIAQRRAAFEMMCDALSDEPGIELPPRDTKRTFSSHHLFLLKIKPEAVGADIQALKAKLKEKGVTEVAHFGPLYRFDIVRQLGYDEDAIAKTCPNTEEMFYRRYTHLPLYPLTKAQVRYMAGAVKDAVRELREGR